MAFAAHGLQRSGIETRISGDHLEETTNALNARIWVFRINHCAIADDVIGDDDGSRTRESERPLKVGGMFCLSASIKMKSNGGAPSLWSCESDSNAGPSRSSTMEERPARFTLAFAISACLGSTSRVTSLPLEGSARASHMCCNRRGYRFRGCFWRLDPC